MLILLPPSEKKSPAPGPAISVNTGVLYAALGWELLPAAAQARGSSVIAIISAKNGAIQPLTEITAYQEKINNKKMRAVVAKTLDAIETDLIIDCRSATYQSVWKSPTAKTVEIKVFTLVAGEKKVITHMSKKTRGEVARALLLSSSTPETPQQLEKIITKSFTCKLIKATAKKPWVLEVYC